MKRQEPAASRTSEQDPASSCLRVMTVEDVIELLRVSRDTVYRLACSGELPGRKVGHAWRFCADEVETYLRRRTAPEQNNK